MTKKQYAKLAVVSFAFNMLLMTLIWPDDPMKNVFATVLGVGGMLLLFKVAEWVAKP